MVENGEVEMEMMNIFAKPMTMTRGNGVFHFFLFSGGETESREKMFLVSLS